MRRTLRSHGLLPMIALLAVCVPTKAQPNPFTIEQVMSAPFPSDLVAAPAGGKSPGCSTPRARGTSGWRSRLITRAGH